MTIQDDNCMMTVFVTYVKKNNNLQDLRGKES